MGFLSNDNLPEVRNLREDPVRSAGSLLQNGWPEYNEGNLRTNSNAR